MAMRYGLVSFAVVTALLLSTGGSSAADETPVFRHLFNGKDLTGWKIPDGDNGHWKVVDGVIDYDASSETKGDKSLYSEREFGDFELHVEWRIKSTPFTNPNVYYLLPDGTHARDSSGKPAGDGQRGREVQGRRRSNQADG